MRLVIVCIYALYPVIATDWTFAVMVWAVVPALLLMHGPSDRWKEILVRALVQGAAASSILSPGLTGYAMALIFISAYAPMLIWSQALLDRPFGWRLSQRWVTAAIVVPIPYSICVRILISRVESLLSDPMLFLEGYFTIACMALSTAWILWRATAERPGPHDSGSAPGVQ